MTQLFTTTINGYVNLFTFDLSAFGDSVYGFIDSSPGTGPTPELSTVTWNGQIYLPLPFTTSGYQRGGDALVRPKINLPDGGSVIYNILRGYKFASGAPVVRYQALAADILSGNVNAPFVTEKYLLNKASFDGAQIELELATPVDYQRNQVPSHVMYRTEYPGLGSQLAD